MNKIIEEGNETVSISYSKDSLYYATGGRDAIVRVYDE